ncbi:hypothetical protein ACQCLI_20025 [Pseudomonas nitroreducens]|uniref:hypothetical protein n=1 Tax=Pseudomonas nitroreducens TaxID=46680 RepID=UPI0012FD7BED|nr:hypothetical protein [Pseudomonas nitroreducens]
MKQENRFVAQLFHYLAPFIDMGRDLFICVDGGAAKHHAGQVGAALIDPDVPDLWFYLVGKESPVGIEAKVIEAGSISVRQGQLQAWKTGGIGAYQPSFWVAANRTLTEFYCWHHADIRRRLDESRSCGENVKMSLRHYPPGHRGNCLAELALYILTTTSSGQR